MKYLVTAAMALALTGAAASALADNPPGHKDEHHATASKSAPKPKEHAAKPGGVRTAGGPAKVERDGRKTGAHAAAKPSAGAHRSRLGSHALRPSDKGRAAYNPAAFRRTYRPTQRFHVAAGARPGGWYAHTWSYGDHLPGGWLAPAYYLNWGAYALAAPPIGCEWVREGADAVLVNIWTGEVLSVERGVFY